MKKSAFLLCTAILFVLLCSSLGVEAGDLLPSNARFVEVMKHDLANTMLHIGEIEVFAFGTVPDELDTDGTSLNDLVQAGSPSAQVPPTTQQRAHGAQASVYDGDLEAGAAVWTTQDGLPIESRYMLDLGTTHPIDIVRVWGRLDQCCFERLEDFSVTLYADNGSGQPGEVVSTVRYRSVAPASADGPVELSLAIVSPTLAYFHADHETIAPSEPVTFSWKVNPAFTSVSIDNGIGDVTAQTLSSGIGSYTLTPGPTANATYTMTVVRPTETKQAPRLITVSDQPIIRAFNSSHSLVSPGSPVQLDWDVANAVSLDLNGTDVTGTTNATGNPQTSTQYTLTAVNLNGSANETRSVTVVAPGEAIISEFMADNDGAYLDEDLDASDWIELNNPTAVSANLNGYYLTDDPLNLMKWQMPNVTLNPGTFLVVFASGKDRSVAGSELHANFSLNAGGEYLALVKPDGTTIVSEFSPEFVKQKNGISYGYGSGLSEQGYLLDPTPGADNGESYLGFVKDTSFDVDRGFYDAPISVTITTLTEGAQVRYTLDGTEPTGGTGYVWSSPITIDSTTILRAAAFKPNYVPTDIDTHTYIFRSDVIASDVMDPSITQDPVYGPKMADSLVAIPTVSLVSQGDIMRSEQPCSVELIGFESGNTQEDCGMARFGNYVTNFEKRNVRLYFRSDYGASKLNYPLFTGYEHGVQPVHKFDRLDLRTGGHDMWQRGFYMSNRFVDDTLLEMGNLCTHGRYVHVYLNGTYWGQYHLRERWDATLNAEYLGGEKEDYEAIASNRGGGSWSPGTPYDGDGSAWENVKNLADNFIAVRPYLNVESFIDFMILWMSGSAEAEMRTVSPVAAGSGFKFQMNDADGYLLYYYRNMGDMTDNEGPDYLLDTLLTEGHPDFKMLMADRIHKHYFNDGAFTPERNRARLSRWGDIMEMSIIAEIARWKNMLINESSANYGFATPEVWKIDRDSCLNDRLPGLTQLMIDRFRARGLYPLLDAPAFSQHGGIIPESFQLEITAPATIYYTLDGSDPRLPGGAISSTALSGTTVQATLNQDTTVKARTKDGGAWSALNEASFVIEGRAPAAVDNLVITEVHYNPDGSDDYEFIELYNSSSKRVDLSGVSITTGINLTFAPGVSIAPFGYGVVVRNAGLFESRYQEPVSPWYYPAIHVLGQWLPTESLSNGGESITLVASNSVQILRFSYSDSGFWPGRADGDGSSLELVDPLATPNANPSKNAYLDNASYWRSSSEYHGSPGRAGTSANVVINEILSHSDLGEDWIELYNLDASTVNIGGWYLSDSKTNLTQYTIPGGTQIPGDQYLTFTESQLGFAFSELGDDAALTVFSGSNLLYFIDWVDFGAGDREVSFGRYVRSDGETDFPALSAQTLDSKNAYPLVGPLVISEIMYNPTNTGPEYVELVNITADPVELFDTSNPTSTWKLSSAVDYVFPTNQIVPPYGVVLLSGMNESALRTALPDLADVQVFGPWDGALGNQGESVKLSRPGFPEPNGYVPYILLDRVSYENDAPWPLDPDGAGPSLERIAQYRYGNDPVNWRASTTVGGTPGVVNGSLAHMFIETTGLGDGTGRIRWAGVPGQEYTVEYCDSLLGSWLPLQTITADAIMAEATDPDFSETTHRFYRIRWVK